MCCSFSLKQQGKVWRMTSTFWPRVPHDPPLPAQFFTHSGRVGVWRNGSDLSYWNYTRCCLRVSEVQGQVKMNTTDQGSNFTSPSSSENITLDSTTISPTILLPPSHSSDNHDPHFTIMMVLGLSLLLAGFAAFLAVCRPSGQDEDSDASCDPGGSLTHRSSQSSEPQLKVWKRLGSYRRSYNLSFRRPPYRRPHERESTSASRSPPRQTTLSEASVVPHLTVPCLFDYVTEI